MSNNTIFRRNFLKGLVVSSTALVTGQAFAKTNNNHQLEYAYPKHFYDTIIPFGEHQAGIITPEQKEAIFIAFKVLSSNIDELRALFQSLSERIIYLTSIRKVTPDQDKKLPPKESGLLGDLLLPDQLTITLSVGATLFDHRFGLSALKPKHLVEMSSFPNDQLDANWCGGDISLQLCANSKEIIIYALRDIMKHHSKQISPIWKIDGFLPSRDLESGSTAINLFGFKDGTGNPSNTDDNLMNEIVWITGKNKEPKWCLGGSYQAIRLIKFNLEFWDRTPLEDQENNFGRTKVSGAPIGLKNEMDDPLFIKDPHGDRILFDSHMRRAEPRNPQRHTAPLRRRSYSYSLGLTKSGLLDMGLIFISYQNDLKKGFIQTQRRLDGEPLERYIKPFGGGYFFALPGIKNAEDYLGSTLLK